MDDTIKVAIIAIVLLYSVILHEIMHGWSALMMGDDTAKRDGRLTLNPIPHIDPWWTILLPAILLYSSRGHFCFGGAKPVRIDALNFRNPFKGMMISAAAGPATNFVLALVAALALIGLSRWAPHVIHQGLDLTYNGLILGEMLLINLGLFMFNLVPIPPLDGSRVLSFFLSADGRRKMEMIERSGMSWALLIAFLFFSDRTGLLSSAIASALDFVGKQMGYHAYVALLRGLSG